MHLELDDVVERARNFPMEVLVEVVGSVLELVVSVVFLSFSNPLWKRGAEGEGRGCGMEMYSILTLFKRWSTLRTPLFMPIRSDWSSRSSFSVSVFEELDSAVIVYGIG